jgi:hypothetical protein
MLNGKRIAVVMPAYAEDGRRLEPGAAEYYARGIAGTPQE